MFFETKRSPISIRYILQIYITIYYKLMCKSYFRNVGEGISLSSGCLHYTLKHVTNL